MFVKRLLICLAPLWPTFAMAQLPPTVFQRCGGVFGLCGLIDWATGAEVGPQVYERILDFSEGLAPARIDGRFGYIDAAGKVVIQPAYDLAGPFRFGLAEALMGKKVGIIDRSGEWVVTPRFARAVPISPDVVVAYEGEWRQNYYDGSEQLDTFFLLLNNSSTSGLYHIIDGWVTDRIYKFNEFDPKGRGLIWATAETGGEDLWGLMRSDGIWQIEPIFTGAGGLSDDVAVVRTGALHPVDQTTRWGAIDLNGAMFINPQQAQLSSFLGGFFLTSLYPNKGPFGLLDMQMNLVGGRMFEEFRLPEPPLDTWRVEAGGKEYLVMRDGTFVPYRPEPLLPPPIWVRPQKETGLALLECPGKARLVRDGDNWGMLGPSGDILIPAIYPAIDCFKQGVAWVPIIEEKQWCPLGPDGKRRDRPVCKVIYEPMGMSHHGQERFADDPFDSTVLWMRAFLDVLKDPTLRGPRLIGDGVQGHGEIEIRSRDIF